MDEALSCSGFSGWDSTFSLASPPQTLASGITLVVSLPVCYSRCCLFPGDTPHGLKPNGFSCLHTSYASMRGEPQTRGRCHIANYVGDTKFPTILLSNVVSPNSISMPGEAALLIRAVKHSSCDLALAAVSTFGACLTCRAF